MNRVIKFRAWYPKHKIMSKVYGYMWEEEGINSENLEKYSYDERILMQFTGLKDKNNKEIYEGDIVKGHCLNDGNGVAVVGFDTFGIYYTKIEHYPCEEYENTYMFGQEHNEVIGNIFENPELLK